MTTLELSAGGKETSRGELLLQWRRLICVLFFFSGFPALIYQLTWQRALFRIFGVNIESVTIVVMQGAVHVAVAINAAVAFGALVAYWRDRRCPVAVMQAEPAPPGACNLALGFAPTLILAAAGGFVSLSYEIFFFRTVSYATASSSTAFAVTLSAFLVGLASGARQ